MTQHKRIALLAGAALLGIIPLAALAGGSWQTWSLIGGASYCASTSTTASGQACTQTVPAGEATFMGDEVVPMDLNTPGVTNGGPQQSGLASILQLGQGATQVLTAVTATTMAPGTSILFVDGADASAFTITLPASPIEGQFAEVACSAVTVGSMTVAANSVPASTVLLPTFTPAACTAGTAFKYRYNAALNTWFKV